MISRTTFQDAIDHGYDYLGSNPSDQAKRDVVRSVLTSYRELTNAHNWTYLYTHGRIVTSGAMDGGSTGATVTYLQSSGSYPFQVTISGGTWPDWAGDGTYIRIATDGEDPETSDSLVNYRVAQRVSATVLTLTPTLNPFQDIATPSDFTLYRDTYLLPEDYVSQDQSLYELNFGGMQFTHPKDWLYENRYVFAQGIPQRYTITGDSQYPGRLVLRVFPWPYQCKTIDFLYKRRPRPLLLPLVTAGTVSVTAGTNTVTGSGTTFTPAMVGSVLRIAATGTKPPQSLIMGGNAPVFETIITGYSSATSIAILDDADITYTSAPMSISDSIDVEEGAMLTAFLRGVEKQLGMTRTLKDKPSAAKQYTEALREARSADSRSFAGRSAGQPGSLRMRMRDEPYTFAIE